MSNTCIEAARTVVDFFPDEPSAHFIYDQGPWWCIVHHMMQAVAVLLLGLSYPASTSYDSMLLMHCVKKVIGWLQIMQDPVAERAYQIAMSSFETVSRRHPIDVSDLWRLESVQGRGVEQPIDPNMAAFVPTQFVSHDTAMATYAAYDALPTSATFPAYNAPPVFSENYYIGR
jgi:hypothetical protein